MKRKIVLLTAAMTMGMALTACGGSGDGSSSSDRNPEADIPLRAVPP